MKILITGGHLSPALSIIEKLKDDQVFFVGRKYAMEADGAISLEYQEIKKRNIPFFDLKTGRLQRKFSKNTIPSLAKMPLGFFNSIKILRTTKPDVILGFGGYVSVPIIIAGTLLGIPSVIHEQTFEAGLANKSLAPFVNKICISWESSRSFFPSSKTVLTGLPIKQELIDVKNEKKMQNKIPVIYITGGSLGSHTINELVFMILNKLLSKFRIIHQTGDARSYADFEKAHEIRNSLPDNMQKNYVIKKFLDSKEAAETMQKADFIVGRSGANTVYELLFLEKPSLLIPITFTQKAEQYKNAQFLQQVGLAEIEDENTINAKSFEEKILKMYVNLSNYRLKSKDKFDFENSADKVIKVVKDVYKKKKT